MMYFDEDEQPSDVFFNIDELPPLSLARVSPRDIFDAKDFLDGRRELALFD